MFTLVPPPWNREVRIYEKEMKQMIDIVIEKEKRNKCEYIKVVVRNAKIED